MVSPLFVENISQYEILLQYLKFLYLCGLKHSDMRIITKTTIKEYIDRNPNSRIALLDWVKKTEKAEWHNFSDIKKTFNSVDYVGNQHYVFNIKGNDFRLVVVIQFTPQHVYIRFIGTHAEYDNIKDIKNL